MPAHLRFVTVAVATISLLSMPATVAADHDAPVEEGEHQHGTEEGHLIGTGAWGNIQLVGQVTVHDIEPELIADVATYGNYAYLANWGRSDCAGPETGGVKKSPDAGVYIIDIRNLAQPREVGFIPMHQDTRPGEGMHVINVTTSKFSGQILAVNEEACGKNYKAGFSLWDVTDPLKPKKLVENYGDFTVDGARKTPHKANETHSVFIWDAGARAYLVAQDEWESLDVDIFDITDPKHPFLVSETDLNAAGVAQPELGLTDSFLHDMIVKQVGAQFLMLLSYWDGGYVIMDVTNPASPRYLRDTDYLARDPLFPAISPPEGNGHQAEFTIDNRFFIATDEDFTPYRLQVNTDDPGAFWAKAGTQTTTAQATAMSGTTVFAGRACIGDTAVPAAPAVGTRQIAVVERGLCTFEEKVQNVLRAGGYEGVIIVNREGADACNAVLTPSLTAALPTVFIGRESGFALFDVQDTFNLAQCLDATPTRMTVPVGTVGDVVSSVSAAFDGWGYVHLFNATTMVGLDQYAIEESRDEDFATGFGDLSVHEVAVDPLDPSLAYLSYYAGGLRAVDIVETATGPTGCATLDDDAIRTAPCLVEVGGYLDDEGNNFWGVETIVRNGVVYILASDRDSGLWIFRRTP